MRRRQRLAHTLLLLLLTFGGSYTGCVRFARPVLRTLQRHTHFCTVYKHTLVCIRPVR